MVKYILQQSQENVDSLDKIGQTPLMVAALYGQADVFDYVLPLGNKLTAINEKQNNILHLAVIGGSLSIVKRVLSLNVVSIESKVHYRRTPVLMAARFGHREVMELLIDEGCNVKVVDKYNNNALHQACLKGRLNTVIYILTEEFIDIDSRGFRQQTAIMLAVITGHTHLFGLLLERGCNVHLANNEGNNILHLACISKHAHIVNTILSLGIINKDCKGFLGKTPILLAAYSGCTKCFDLLLSSGSDLNAVDRYKNTILHTACTGGHVNMINHIHFVGNLSLNVTRTDGLTLMMVAAFFGNMEAFDFLLSKGSDVKATNHKGENVLHFACKGRRVKMVKHLLRLNLVDPNQRNHKGRTPRQVAEEGGYNEMAKLFH